MRNPFRLCAAAGAIAVSGACFPVAAQEGAAFFKDKTVTYIVATDPGGGYDTNGRLVAEYMQKHLPGSTVVVQNMPGAGHLIGTNYIYASEPDGLTIGTFNTGLIYGQLAGDPGAKFDLAKMTWIGKVSSDPRVVVVSSESGIFRSTWEKFVAEGHGKFIAQIGGSQTDVPQLVTFATNDESKKVIALIESQATIARLTAGPPGIPEDRVQALVDAYGKATSDPEFLEKAKALKLPVEPLAGQAVADAVAAAMQPSPDLIAFLKEMMKKE